MCLALGPLWAAIVRRLRCKCACDVDGDGTPDVGLGWDGKRVTGAGA
jgi:hypothetical protein